MPQSPPRERVNLVRPTLPRPRAWIRRQKEISSRVMVYNADILHAAEPQAAAAVGALGRGEKVLL